MKHVIRHHLDIPTAKKVTDRAFGEYKGRYPQYEPKFHWVDDRRAEMSFNAKGVKLKGAMEVAEQQIAVDLDVPFLLRPFQKRALEIIEREVKHWIAKADAGEI